MATINGTPGADPALNGGSGDDVINGLGGNDKIDGGAGNDTIDGGAGDDIIKGGDGDDTITGGLGNDNIVGGAGKDTAVYTTAIAAASTGAAPIGTWSGALLTLVTSGDGTDIVNQVETLRFNGMDFAVTGYNKDGPYNVVANLGADKVKAGDDGLKVSGNVLANDYDVDSKLAVTGLRNDGKPLPPSMPVDDPKAIAGQVGFKIAGQYGFLTLNADGSYIYQAYGKGTGLDHFQYSVTDGGVTRWVNLDIDVSHVNHAPDTGNFSASGDEDATISGQVFAKDRDGDTLTFSQSGSGPAHGSLSFHSDGTYTYTPAANYHGSDGFDFSVSDGHGGTATGHVAINVNSVNDAPTASGGANSGDEDTNISGQVSGFDVDDDKLGFHVVSGPSHGSLDFHIDGSYTYTPEANFNGSDSFTFASNDGTVDSAPATIDLTVNPVNDAPTASGGENSGDEDTTITGHVAGGDVDDDPLTFTLVSGPQHGSLDFHSDGTYSYTPAADYNGSDSFTFKANDGTADSDPATVSLTVNPVNDAPVIDEDTPVATAGGGAFDLAVDRVSFTVIGHVGPLDGTQAEGDNTLGGFLYGDGNATLQQAADYSHFSTDYIAGLGDFIGATIVQFNFDTDGYSYVLGNASFTASSPGSHDRLLLYFANPDGTPNPLDMSVYHVGSFSNQAFIEDGRTGVITITAVLLDYAGDAGASTAGFFDLILSGYPTPLSSGVAMATSPVEDTAFSGRFHAHDVDGDVLTFSLVAGHGPAHGQAVVNADGSFTYTPDADYSGSDSFQYQVSDGHGGTDTATYSFTVAAVNDLPVAADASASAPEDTVITGSVHATDVDGDTLTYSVNSLPSHGSLTLHSDGTYTYTPDANYFGPDSFEFIANDGHGDSNVGTITLDINPSVNDAPVAADGSAATNEDTTVTGSVHATDADSDPLNYTVASGPTHGSLSFHSDGTYSYTPNADFHGADGFDFQVSDGNGGTDTGHVSIDVASVNDAPVASNDKASGDEDTTITGSAHATDADNDTLTYSLVNGPTHGSLSFHPDGTYSYTPAADYNGSDSFTFKANDGTVDSNTATVNLNVNSVNDAPVIDEDIPVATGGGVFAASIPGVTLTVIGHVGPLEGPVNAYNWGAVFTDMSQAGILYGDGNATLQQAADYSGFSTGYIQGFGDFLGATIVKIDFLIPPGSDVVGLEFDYDFLVSSPGSHDRVLAKWGHYDQHIDGADYFGVGKSFVQFGNKEFDGAPGDHISLTLVVLDYAGDAGASQVNAYNIHLVTTSTVSTWFKVTDPLHVSGSGAPPAPVEDTPFKGQFHAHDVDGDVLTFSLVDGHGPAHGHATVNSDGSFTYTPDANYNGSDSFQYQVSDGHGGTDTATYSFKVAAVNDAPVASGASASGDEDTTITGSAHATDADNDKLTYSLVNGPAHGSLTFNSDGTYSYTPVANYHGGDSFTFKANDGTVDSNTATINIAVASVNDAPNLGKVSFNGSGSTIDEDTTLSGTLHARDADGDTLAFSLTDTGAPAHGTVDIDPETGAFTYTPEANYNGSDSFTYQVSDGNGGVVTDTVAIDVTPVNDAPVTEDAKFDGPENQIISGSVSATDADGDSLIFSVGDAVKVPSGAGGLLTTVEHGKLDFHSDGTFTYSPDHGFFGVDGFDFFVDDGHGGETSGHVTLNVTEHNIPPVASGASATLDEDTTLSGHVTATDADGDKLGFKVVSGPQHGSLSFNVDGTYVYTPEANYNGSDSFTFFAYDGRDESETETVNLTVTPVNDAPDILQPRALRGDEDHGFKGQALAKDREGDKLSFELVDKPIPGLTFNKDGTWTFDPTVNKDLQALDYNQTGSISFSYRAYDGHDYSQIVTQFLSIQGVNEELTGGTAGKDNLTGTGVGDYINVLGGDDTVHAGGGADQVYGGDGNDKLYGGDGDDDMHGDGGNDTVNGEAGNDTLVGNAGADTMDGGDGDDDVRGGDDNDVVKGGAGNDHVYGDAGADDVQGGIGDDWVYGGAGADRLSGGAGADHFVFVDGDLGSTLATSDTITDFKTVQGDVLDFSGIDANTTLGGDQGFSIVGSFGHHAGEMTMAYNAGINATVISMDTNGDGVADYVLQLTGAVTSTAGWVL